MPSPSGKPAGVCVCVCVYVTRACVRRMCACVHVCMHVCMYACRHVDVHMPRLQPAPLTERRFSNSTSDNTSWLTDGARAVLVATSHERLGGDGAAVRRAGFGASARKRPSPRNGQGLVAPVLARPETTMPHRHAAFKPPQHDDRATAFLSVCRFSWRSQR